MQRQGKYPPPPGAPDIPGLELRAKCRARRLRCALKAGDKITALVSRRAYAEYAVVHETNRAAGDRAAFR